MRTNSWDVVVVGAGAAGLMAAAAAAASGAKTLVLEKNRKLGVKILMSGGTRCNITHHCDRKEIVKAFGRNGKFLHSALATLPPERVVEMLEGEGVKTKVEATGKVFPVSDRAIDVRDALVRLATKATAEIETDQAVESIELNNNAFDEEDRTNRFQISTPRLTVQASSLIITTGGKSYPGCGTTGDGYAWAEQFQHAILPTYPALTPIVLPPGWVQSLKGITVDPVVIRVLEFTTDECSGKAKTLAQRQGSLLFTHWGLSGPAALDVSREIASHPQRRRLELALDFLPQRQLSSLDNEFQALRQQVGGSSASNMVANWFPRRLAETMLELASIAPDQRLAEISKHHQQRLWTTLKDCRVGVSGTLGFEKAEVTHGGVCLKHVDSRTMSSKHQPGLFFAGEILDLDGYIGGYNFQAAFSTGWLAGIEAAKFAMQPTCQPI